MTDPISDMLARIKNGYAVQKEAVSAPYAKFSHAVAQAIAHEGFLLSVERKGRARARTLVLTLRYIDGEPALIHFKRISKPGQRVYSGYASVRKITRGRGVVFVSTPKGVMTAKEAQRARLGGEVLCEVW